MPISRDEINFLYRGILGRIPESEQVIVEGMNGYENFEQARDSFLRSDEFSGQLSKLIEADVGKARLPEHAHISYSQFGEDLLLKVMFHGQSSPGTYVDVGAHHPARFSNTKLFYDLGWSGINVEGDAGLIDAFNVARLRDININAFVSDREEEVQFHRFDETAVNTLSAEKAEHYARHWNAVGTATVKTRTLADILSEHLAPGRKIDFLSIDAEGLDLRVLRGNDWTKFRPEVVVVEIEGLDLKNLNENEIIIFMAENGYRLYSFLHVSAFFIAAG